MISKLIYFGKKELCWMQFKCTGKLTVQKWHAQCQNPPYEDILLSTLPHHDSNLEWLQFLDKWLYGHNKT